MSECWLECDWCGFRRELGPIFSGCPACLKQCRTRPLELKYSGVALAPGQKRQGLWRWESLLPPIQQQHRFTLGEGATPLLDLHADRSGRVRLLLKNETCNPTWSWKDRPNAVSVSAASQYGFERVAASSTGNHGNSVAAYAASAGLSSVILCEPDTPLFQLALMQGYGARVVRGGRTSAILSRLVKDHRYFPCTILCPRAGYTNPFGVEGFKTIAFEIFEELGRAPDRIYVASGSGDGTYGIWKGFRELVEHGGAKMTPRIFACQSTGANSLFRAWRRHAHHVERLTEAATIALSVREPVTGDHALRAVYESGGSVGVVSDELARQAVGEMQRQGFALEPASALPYACAKQDLLSVPEGAGETWVLIGSGAAVKWPDYFLERYLPPLTLQPDAVDLIEEE